MISLSRLKKLHDKGAVKRVIETEFKSEPAEFVEEISISVNDLLKKDLKQAGEYVPRLDKIFRHLPPRYKPRLLAIKARYNHWDGKPKKALNYYLRARELHEKAGEWEALARLGKGLLDVYKFLGKYDQALETGKKSLRYFRKKGLMIDAADVMNNIGNIYHRNDKNHLALKYYDKAREIFLDSDELKTGIVEFNRANIFANMNKLEKAEALYLKAAGFFKNLNMEIAENQITYSLAYLYFLQDRYTDAIKLFEKVYSKFRQLGDKKTAMVTLLDMAEMDIHLNQFSSAVMLSDQIIPEFRKLGMRYEQSKACYFAADARIRLGDYQSASIKLRKARNLFEKEQNNLWLGMVNIANGRLNAERGYYSRASKAARDAIDQFEKSGDKRRKIDAELELMKSFVLSGDTANASKMSRSLSRKNLVSYQKYNLNYMMGKCYYRMENYSGALEKFREAVSIVEKMLNGLYPDEIRFFFAIDKHNCYNMVVDCLLKLKKIDDSFLENLKALQTINYAADFGIREQVSIPKDLIEQRNSLRAALKKLNHLERSEQRHLQAPASYASLEQKLWSNERKIRSILYPRAIQGKNGKFDLAELQKSLRPDEVVFNFFSSGTNIGAFVADNKKTEFIEFDISSSDLDFCLQKLHFVFESAVFGLKHEGNGHVAESYLSYIYRHIFKPLTDHTDKNQLIIIADGSFAQIPFSALRDGRGRLMMDQYEIKLAVNPESLKQGLSSNHKFGNRRNAVFAISSDSLPSTETEANRIKEVFRRAHVYIDEKAGSRNLLNEIKKADGFIHIAAHASRSSENPLFSRILMGDGPFFPFDLFQSGIQAELITLSGCQTAAPGLYQGNSFSLAKSFFQAGARYVLATLWPVTDKISMVFMDRFYDSLKRKKNIFSAYLDAVYQIKGITDNPAFWSSFILLGI
ncbi:MAG: CHAT domain-containing protein [candidate division Zixibacteria bacterium]|nr:CHAT domain-containing protein [candidate division Zixibacteria bacterium]